METLFHAQDPQVLCSATCQVLMGATRADQGTLALVPSGECPVPRQVSEAGAEMTDRRLMVALHNNGCQTTILTCRRRSRDFTGNDLEQAMHLLPVVRAIWLAMSHRLQTLRLTRIIASGDVNSQAGMILVDHPEMRVLEVNELAAATMGSGGSRLAAGSMIPEPLRGLLSADRRESRTAAPPDRLHTLPGGTVQIHSADPGFGGEVVLVMPPRAAQAAGLTSRQLEVIALLNEGQSNKQIATRLAISVATVKKHLEMMYGILGVNNRTAAVHRLQQMDLKSAVLHRTDPGADFE